MKTHFPLRWLFPLLLLAIPANRASAQAPPPMDFTGRSAPEFSLTVTGPEGRLLGTKTNPDYLGKWLILDFWTRSCIACITSMPKLSALQGSFSDQMTILLVGKNDAKYNKGIEQLYARIRKSEHLQLQAAFDTAIFSAYKVRTTPHVVLIDPKGTIHAVTGSAELTREKLSALLNGQPVQFDPMPGFVNSAPNPPGGGTPSASYLGSRQHKDGLGYSSDLSQGVKNGAGLRLDLAQAALSGRFQSRSISLERLYLLAYLGRAEWSTSDSLYLKTAAKINIKVTDSNHFVAQGRNQVYNYELVLSGPPSMQAMMSAMQGDLARRFGYRVRWVDQPATVYQLISTRPELLRRSSDTLAKAVVSGDASGLRMKNISTADLLSRIGYFHEKQLFEDRSFIGYPLDIDLEFGMLNLAAIRKALQKNGLDLSPRPHLLTALEVSTP